MFKLFKGVCGPKELNKVIDVVRDLDQKSPDKLAKIRWVVGERTVVRLLRTARRVFLAQSSLVEDLTLPSIFVGDLHGDIQTLLDILNENGMPPTTSYVFLGDYVDRGVNSMEVLLLVLALKCKYPDHVTVLRGNHETPQMTRVYGFFRDCSRRYSTYMYDNAIKTFSLMPLAAVVDGSIFAVHGGLSPLMQTLDDIRAIKRPIDIKPDTIVCDMLWSDPCIEDDREGFNEGPRGCGFYFGKQATNEFLDRNNLSFMVRGHEACFRGSRRHFGRCWTVFSQPQYCGETNAAAVLRIDADREVHSLIHVHKGVCVTPFLEWPIDAECEPMKDHPLGELSESNYEFGGESESSLRWSESEDGESSDVNEAAAPMFGGVLSLIHRDPTRAHFGGDIDLELGIDWPLPTTI